MFEKTSAAHCGKMNTRVSDTGFPRKTCCSGLHRVSEHTGLRNVDARTTSCSTTAHYCMDRRHWNSLPLDVLQLLPPFLDESSIAAARLVCRSWRAGISAGVTCLRLICLERGGLEWDQLGRLQVNLLAMCFSRCCTKTQYMCRRHLVVVANCSHTRFPAIVASSLGLCCFLTHRGRLHSPQSSVLKSSSLQSEQCDTCLIWHVRRIDVMGGGSGMLYLQPCGTMLMT